MSKKETQSFQRKIVPAKLERLMISWCFLYVVSTLKMEKSVPIAQHVRNDVSIVVVCKNVSSTAAASAL